MPATTLPLTTTPPRSTRSSPRQLGSTLTAKGNVMIKIRFLQDRVVQDGLQGTAHETRFSAGQVVELAEASAAHWLSRGVAERVLEEVAPAAPAQQQESLDLPNVDS